MDANQRLWTHDETATWLHISPWTLHHLCINGRGPNRYKVGKHHRYDPTEVRSWLRTHLSTTTSRAGTR
ncbi:hypothetical protein GCM10010123_02310 [Pilimelia anulata]|uniref:Helix-turn-helix domain-containing protein n=1 Tax=Pilimelia anulata TaxID=53371 RepID=A0A8J3F5Y7_9ACTN|nr:helix-turn-helix domain-containing protein [Pilimelia anulata]GGJ75922.1 hypothetical protein GCM10010123_02310 [Pilimelia anulata]